MIPDQVAQLRRAIADLKFSASVGSGVTWIGATADIGADPMHNDTVLGAQAVHESLHPEKRARGIEPVDKAIIDVAEAAYDALASALKHTRGQDAPGLAAIDRNYRRALFDLLEARLELDPEFLQWIGR